MNISDRIQHLRKTKGITQEELADKIGVSRQSVSKWESEQTSPDLDKVILMCDYFEVTTDYLLKGIEPPIPDDKTEMPNARIFSTTAVAFHGIGLIVAAMTWYTERTAVASAVGLILQVMGWMIYSIGLAASDPSTLEDARKQFRTIGAWSIPFIPMSMAYNLLLDHSPAPYPLVCGSIVPTLLFWIAYFLVGVAVSMCLRKQKKR